MATKGAKTASEPSAEAPTETVAATKSPGEASEDTEAGNLAAFEAPKGVEGKAERKPGKSPDKRASVRV